MSLFEHFPHRCTIQRRVKTNDSVLGGAKYTRTVEQTAVECWEQRMSTTEVLKYAKQGMSVTTKVYFKADPGTITDRHEIIITRRNGVAVPAAQQQILQNLLPDVPDAGAGLGVLFKVVGSYIPGGGA